jgi:type II secretory pathway pseudopilin PulG
MKPTNCRRRTRLPRRGRAGFTFMEVILATAMMSVIALSLFASLRIAFRARDTALAAVGPARSAEVAADMVRRDLESAMPPTGVLAGSFIGQYGSEVFQTSAVQFYAVAGPAGAGAAATTGGAPGYGAQNGAGDPTQYGGVCRVELLVRASADGGTGLLVRRVTRNLLAPSGAEAEEEILCRGVKSFGLMYFDGAQWLDTWDSTLVDNILPSAVEMTLELARPGPAGMTSDATPAYRTSRVFFLPCRREASPQGSVPQ